MESVKLIENFVSWQGEGPDSGKTMIILRFKTCNRNCSWCDTSVKMRVSAEASYNLSDIQETVFQRAAGLLITGGEPTVPKHFDETVTLLNDLHYPCANVESNGFKLPELVEAVSFDKPVKFMYSPKVFGANDESEARDTLEKLQQYQNVYLKLVYEPDNKYSMGFMYHVIDNAKDLINNQRVWLMPMGTNRADLIKNAGPVFDVCEKYNFNFSSRSHIMFGFV